MSDKYFFKVCRNVRNGALIANPNNCRAYIECQQNFRLDRECERNELFEALSGVCLSDFTVDCGDRPTGEVGMRNVRRFIETFDTEFIFKDKFSCAPVNATDLELPTLVTVVATLSAKISKALLMHVQRVNFTMKL